MNAKTLGSIKRQRSIHFVDIENLCAKSKLTENDVRAVRVSYSQKIKPGSLDQFVLTVSTRKNLLATKLGWPECQLLSREGKNGADFIIADEIKNPALKNYFSRVYLASGDGGLVEVAKMAIAAGISLCVVSNRYCLSRNFRRIGVPIYTLPARKSGWSEC